MASVRVTRELEQPVDRVWGVISDFGNIGWMPEGTEVRLEGDGPGMIRHIGAGALTLAETLESVDDASRTLVVRPPSAGPMRNTAVSPSEIDTTAASVAASSQSTCRPIRLSGVYQLTRQASGRAG